MFQPPFIKKINHGLQKYRLIMPGLVDAEGCFNVLCSRIWGILKLNQRMTLTQQDITGNEEFV
jgi:hypothetical protein